MHEHNARTLAPLKCKDSVFETKGKKRKIKRGNEIKINSL